MMRGGEKMIDEWFLVNDGWFTYYVNKKTGERKFALEAGDVEVDPLRQDDFWREEERHDTI